MIAAGDWRGTWREEAAAALRSMMDAQIPGVGGNHDRAAASATAPCATITACYTPGPHSGAAAVPERSTTAAPAAQARAGAKIP